MSSDVTVTDQFCGAGGSSIGAEMAGARLRLALNHWRLAVETHNTNFPNADHDCTDMSACEPRRYVATDILITSPECTNHSLAKGKARKWQSQLELFGSLPIDPAEERSRATMWDVVRFAEAHRYRIVIVENVVEARWWAPYPAWLQAMELLGYRHKTLYLNSMYHHPTPQSRDRMYVVFWHKSMRAPDLEFRPRAHCPACGGDVASVQSWKRPDRPWGKYGQQYVYRCPTCAGEVRPYYYCAANAIDWSLPAPRIGDRSRPLKEKTRERIRIGLEKFGRQPQLVGNYTPGWTRPVSEPTGTVTTADHHALCVPPFTIETQWSHAEGDRSAAITDPLPTQTGQQGRGLVVPPFLCSVNHSTDRTRPITDPAPTVMPQGNPYLAIPPFIAELRGANAPKGLDEALSTMTGGGTHHGLVLPFLTSYHSTSTGSGIDAPIPTQDTHDRHGLVVPPFLLNFVQSGSDRSRTTSIGSPWPTQVGNVHHALVAPGEIPEVDDCGFRMLQPHEIGRAMAFPETYRVLGTQREQVRLYGNAVTPPVMQWILRQCLQVFG